MRTILLQLHVAQPVFCDAWDDAPVAHGVQICVYADSAGGPAERLARRTHAAIERELQGLGARRVTPPCLAGGSRIYPAYNCSGAAAEAATRMLIFVADGTCGIDPSIEQYFSASGAVVVPLVDRSIAHPPQTALPAFIYTTLAETTRNLDPKPVIPRILRAAGIVASSVRLFISYRHQDAARVAGQLFHALAERGFEPFLDRFCSRPGDDFVDLIREELADKACLVSLETRHIGRSLYCRQEVATAVSRHMGLIAVDLPGSRRTFSVIRQRIDATALQLTPHGELDPNDLEPIVDRIEGHYPHEAARRPRWQDLNLHNALTAARLQFSPEGLGRYAAKGKQGGQHLLAISAGMPRTGLFIDVDDWRQRSGGNQQAAVFGPLSAARSNRYREIGWLVQKSGVRAIDEGRLFRYVKRL